MPFYINSTYLEKISTIDLFKTLLLSKVAKQVKSQNIWYRLCNIAIGVSQETILGPLLFILYVDDLLDSLPANSVLSYADATALVSATYRELGLPMYESICMIVLLGFK